eukprot:1665636-Amphidinium_carterae.1
MGRCGGGTGGGSTIQDGLHYEGTRGLINQSSSDHRYAAVRSQQSSDHRGEVGFAEWWMSKMPFIP